MIAQMKLVTILAGAGHRESAIEKLRSLGVLHVRHVRPPISGEINALESILDNASKAFQLLESMSDGQTGATMLAQELVDRTLALDQARGSLKQELEECLSKTRWFETWGAVSLSSLESLKSAGIHLRFYRADKSRFRAFSGEQLVFKAGEDKNFVYVVLFGASAEDKLDFQEDPIPQVEYSELKRKIESAEKRILEVEKELQELAGGREVLNPHISELERKLQLRRVLDGMGDAQQISFVQGFCPLNSVDAIRKEAEQSGWGYLVEDPEDLSEVPTLLRSPRWMSIVHPIFRFMGTIPGYYEYDISLPFLIFFTIFFAMLIGDAGYGLVYAGMTWLLSRKFKDAPREPFILFYVLSAATVVWGVSSGVYFGCESIGQLPVLRSLVVPRLNGFVDANSSFIMLLTFIIAVAHLTVARMMVVVKYLRSSRAVAEMGWIMIIWTMFFMAGKLVLGRPFPQVMTWVFALGFCMVLFFANFQKNIIKGALATLINLPLSVVSAFSDVVSYLRLFAVGVATVVVAVSFNAMVADMASGSIIGMVAAGVVLLFGHSLNLALGVMAVVVHGLRLNMLEFSGHLGMEWSGREYDPFR